MQTFIGAIGRRTLHVFNQFAILFTFAYQILRTMIAPPKNGMFLVRRITLEQVYFTAVQTLPVIILFAILDIFLYNAYQIELIPVWAFAIIVMVSGGIFLVIFFMRTIRQFHRLYGKSLRE